MISIKSWREVGRYSGEIVLFTDQDYNKLDLPFLDTGNLNIKHVKIKDDLPLSKKAAAAFRLKIFDYIDEEFIFIYCDTDILCRKYVDIDYLLSYCDLDKVNVYGYPNRTQDSFTQAGLITSNSDIISQKAICSGFILFTKKSKCDFKEILSRYSKQKNINNCWEQPMFNYVLLKNKSVNICLDKFFVEERKMNLNKTENHAYFNHFCGLRSDDRMFKMLEKLL